MSEIVRKHIAWALIHVSKEVNDAIASQTPSNLLRLEQHLRSALQELQGPDQPAHRRRSSRRDPSLDELLSAQS